MVILPHALTGARLAQGQTPLGALARGVASHYLLDQVPHLDYDHRTLKGRAIVALELAAVAGTLAAKRRDLSSLAGALGGVLPDAVNVLAPANAATRLHDRLHTPFRPGRTVNVALQAAAALWGLRG